MPETSTKSVYDRQRHLQNLREWLGEDLFFLKNGKTPRKAFARAEVIAAIDDGNHQLAHDALRAFIQFLPWSNRNGSPRWNNYGIVKPDAAYITTIERKQQGFSKAWLSEPIRQRKLWVNHMFMQRSLFPSYRNESRFDTLLMDIDVEIHGETMDLYLLNSDELADILSPVREAVETFSAAVGSPTFEWLLSGFRGFWLQLHVDDTGSRGELRRIRDAIVNCMPGDLKIVEDTPVVQAYGITYTFDDGNLGERVCRVPWSMHTQTENVSVNINPLTGEPDPLRFVEYYSHPTSLHEIAARIPSHMCQRPALICPRWGNPEAGIFGEPPDAPRTEEDDDSQHLDEPHDADQRSRIVQLGDTDRLVDWNTAVKKNASHRVWSWQDVVAEADDPKRQGSWRDLVCRDAPEGFKREILVMGGNLMTVAAAMKGEYGRIDWDEIIQEYEAAYRGRNFRKGGTIRKWVNDLRRDTKQGKTINPSRSALTPAMVQHCRDYADATISALPFPRKPSADSLYHVLLCLCRLCMNRDEFEVSEDYLSRRAGINPYPTWEEQAAAESRPVVATTSPNHKSGSGCTNPPTGGDETAIPASGMLTARLGKNEIETASPRHVRDYPTSANARKRLSVLLKCVCDMDGGETGTKPFVRVAVGTNRYDDERVIQHGRAVGSLFRKVAGHSFWEKMSG